MIKYIQLAEKFNVDRLQQELAGLESSLWKGHYNLRDYMGNWSTIQLRSINGNIENNTAIQAAGLQTGNAFMDTGLMDQCPYIREVTNHFKMDKTAIRLMKLGAGAVIKPHKDDALNFEEGEVRIHIPVVTNPQLKFYLQDDRLVMNEGTCWYLNLSLRHSVSNEGDTDRVHLVIDGIVNSWVEDYFSKEHFQKIEMEDPPERVYNNEEKVQIIAQLRSMKTETGDRLANEMEASLKNHKS